MKKRNERYDNCAYAMILPAYFVFAVFILIPIAVVFYYTLPTSTCIPDRSWWELRII